jgi:AraC family transcriptional regulator, regulatory protein of adaptative response / DNA-3-methyladenine glycosylase II
MSVTPAIDTDTCYRALTARDARFDGRFYVGVATTGIYCRPVCTARTPRRDRCTFYASAAEAEHAGFRACFRCRPELAPGQAPVDSLPRLVTAAIARIEEGFLNERSVEELAGELGVAARHLRRAVGEVLGVSPAELARTRRLALAKQLLHDTDLDITEIALAAGFGSLRRFHQAFRDAFGMPPTAVRRATGARAAAGPSRAKRGDRRTGAARRASPGEPIIAETVIPSRSLILRLGYRKPFDWPRLLGFLAARAVPGVEDVSVEELTYRREVRLGGHAGAITVRDDADHACLRVELAPSLAGVAMAVAARLRNLFDLDAHPAEIAEALGADRTLAPLVKAHPGLRVPGAFDGFEVAVRAILGQQVSVRAASTLAARLVAAHGGAFPTPKALAACRTEEIAKLGLPAARANALIALARAVCDGSLQLDRGAAPDRTIAALEALPGVGPWTAHYVAMRALGWPDAFLAGDLIIRKALGGITARAATDRAEAWRPWRAYAVLHLWTGASP